MREYEADVFKEFAEAPANVKETWPLYDSIVICNELLGSESSVPGWFTSFAAFGAKESHQFFKNRTDGTAGEAYTNMKNGDTMDFAYKIHSIGMEITGTPTIDVQIDSVDGNGITTDTMDAIVPQWWRADLPWHMGIQLRVQQDIRLELPVMAAPAGVGAFGGGLAFQQLNALGTFGEQPWMISQSTQGIPLLRNRFPLPEAIGVPRTGSLEVILHIGEWARTILQGITGPHKFFINTTGAAGGANYFSRYIIRCSLFGERLIQQRAQYHR
jgi:hypothetical protein